MGWAEVPNPQPSLCFAVAFYPNACYWLIRPTLRLFRWPVDVGIGEFAYDDQEWHDFMEVLMKVDALNFYVQVAQTAHRSLRTKGCFTSNINLKNQSSLRGEPKSLNSASRKLSAVSHSHRRSRAKTQARDSGRKPSFAMLCSRHAQHNLPSQSKTPALQSADS
ncbi:hypothetical protein IAD21_03383 [Abditibacteriota bacterium]|nr:hypothetical protein IAD21_03383 [Abditibacteriota bacterium]